MVWSQSHANRSIRDAGLYIMVGRSKDGLVAAANRRLYEDTGRFSRSPRCCCSPGVWLLATMSVGRQVGRLAAMATKLGLGDLRARISPPHPRRRTGRADDAAQRAPPRSARAPARRHRRAQPETQPIPENGGDGSAHRRRGARFQQSAAPSSSAMRSISPRRLAARRGAAPDRRRASQPPPNAAPT